MSSRRSVGDMAINGREMVYQISMLPDLACSTGVQLQKRDDSLAIVVGSACVTGDPYGVRDYFLRHESMRYIPSGTDPKGISIYLR